LFVLYKKTVRSVYLVIFFLGAAAFSGNNPDWQTISTLNEITDMTFFEGDLWATTTGGMYIYEPASGSVRQFDNINGLQSIVLRSIVTDDHGQIIVGGDDGVLQAYNPAGESWNFDFSIRGSAIKDMVYRQDTLWLAAGKGLATYVWDGQEYVFLDFFLNFNVLPSKVYCVQLFSGRVWLGTDVGLLSAPADLSENTINNPDLWTMYSRQNGLLDNRVYELQVIDNVLYAGLGSGLALIDHDLNLSIAQNWMKNAAGKFYPATNIIQLNGVTYISNFPNYYSYSPENGPHWINTFQENIEAFAADAGGSLWIGLNGEGLFTPQWQKPLKFDSPNSNKFRYLYKKKDGSVWASSGRPKVYTGKGFYVKNEQSWRNYYFDGGRWQKLNNTVLITEDRFGNLWLPTWGGGMAAIKAGGELVFFANPDTDGELQIESKDSVQTLALKEADVYKDYFASFYSDKVYIVISYVKEGPDGRLWVANYGAIDDRLITAIPYDNSGFINLDKDSWVSFGRLKDGIVSSEGDISCIEFDDFGRVWIGTYSSGLYVLDYNHTLANKADDKLSHYQMQDNLYSNRVYSIAKDKDGLVWIGTAGGLNSFDGLNIYKHVGDPAGKTGPLENQINQIFVDRYNNKWFATTGGVSILRAGKSAWDSEAWLGISTQNSKLVDDNIQSIYVDPNTSEALIGTDNGLSVYRGAFGQIKKDYSALGTGPNPFVIDESGRRFIISKLKINSTVRIFTLNGALVRELSASQKLSDGTLSVDGGRAVWDGRDALGNTVSSGIYLYMVFTEDGQSAAGKIAVIRR